jgi:hypothetical protein
VISEVHAAWKQLMARTSDVDDLSRACTQADSAVKISTAEARKVVDAGAPKGPDALTDSAVDKWHYVAH